MEVVEVDQVSEICYTHLFVQLDIEIDLTCVCPQRPVSYSNRLSIYWFSYRNINLWPVFIVSDKFLNHIGDHSRTDPLPTHPLEFCLRFKTNFIFVYVGSTSYAGSTSMNNLHWLVLLKWLKQYIISPCVNPSFDEYAGPVVVPSVMTNSDHHHVLTLGRLSNHLHNELDRSKNLKFDGCIFKTEECAKSLTIWIVGKSPVK